jgi:hypothetical protein
MAWYRDSLTFTIYYNSNRSLEVKQDWLTVQRSALYLAGNVQTRYCTQPSTGLLSILLSAIRVLSKCTDTPLYPTLNRIIINLALSCKSIVKLMRPSAHSKRHALLKECLLKYQIQRRLSQQRVNVKRTFDFHCVTDYRKLNNTTISKFYYVAEYRYFNNIKDVRF